jgi:hypothetical protein
VKIESTYYIFFNAEVSFVESRRRKGPKGSPIKTNWLKMTPTCSSDWLIMDTSFSRSWRGSVQDCFGQAPAWLSCSSYLSSLRFKLSKWRFSTRFRETTCLRRLRTWVVLAVVVHPQTPDLTDHDTPYLQTMSLVRRKRIGNFSQGHPRWERLSPRYNAAFNQLLITLTFFRFKKFSASLTTHSTFSLSLESTHRKNLGSKRR